MNEEPEPDPYIQKIQELRQDGMTESAKIHDEMRDIKDCLEDHIKRMFKMQGQIMRIQKRLRDIEKALDKHFGETWRE